MTSNSTGASVSFHVYGSGPTGHMNVTVNTGGTPPKTYGFQANEIGKGLAIGGIGSSSDGIVKIEDDMIQDRSHVNRPVPVTREQAQTIKDALDKTVGKEADYSMVNGQICTDIAEAVYKITGHPGQVGDLFTGQDQQKQPAPVWSAVPGFHGVKPGRFGGPTTHPDYSPKDAIPGHVPDPSLLKPFGWQPQRQTEAPPHVNNNGKPSSVGQFTNPQNSPNPADKPGNGDKGPSSTRESDSPPHAGSQKTDGDKGPSSTKSDTHNGQQSGPNRGLGNGGKTEGDKGKNGSKSDDEGSGGVSKTGESARRGNDPAGPNRSEPSKSEGGKHHIAPPLLLDLDGDGIEITELSRSTVFMDAGGDGLLHRTAWAGAGDGVLFFDANDDNQIGEKREFVFTEWDPTAASDLAALRSYFDRNGDGKLTAADPAFAQVKVMVTNADGSMTARTLVQLGIREISLIGDATHITLPDGSVITGQSSFTRMNGTTGTVADVTLVSDAEGRRVVQTATLDATGARTVVAQAYDADGSLAYAITSVTSRDGLSIRNSYDDNGDGVFDRIQTINTVVSADGARIETLVNYQGSGLASAAVVNRTVTTTSADRRSLTIERDSTGGGWFDQVERRVTQADGSRTTTISDLARDGRVIASSTETVSANGNSRVEAIDLNGDGLIDTRTTDAFAQQGAERVNTVTVSNRDDSLRTATQERVSADGKSKTVLSDLDGNGVYETQKQSSITTAASGTSTSVLNVRNADGSLRSRTEQSQSADALTKTIRADVDGDGDFDATTVNVTAIAINGSRTETLTTRNIDGSIREMARTTLAADKVTRQEFRDLNQDGTFQATDLVASVTVAAASGAAGRLAARDCREAGTDYIRLRCGFPLNGPSINLTLRKNYGCVI